MGQMNSLLYKEECVKKWDLSILHQHTCISYKLSKTLCHCDLT